MNSMEERQKRKNEFDQKSIDFIRSKTIEVCENFLSYNTMNADVLMTNLMIDILRDDNSLFTITSNYIAKKHERNFEIVTRLKDIYTNTWFVASDLAVFRSRLFYAINKFDENKSDLNQFECLCCRRWLSINNRFEEKDVVCISCSERGEKMSLELTFLCDVHNLDSFHYYETRRSIILRNLFNFIHEEIINRLHTLLTNIDNNEYSLFLGSWKCSSDVKLCLFNKEIGDKCIIYKRIIDDLKSLTVNGDLKTLVENEIIYDNFLNSINERVTKVLKSLEDIFMEISMSSRSRGYVENE